MKIKYAIHSSDSNPFYLDFWPLVSKIWKLKFNIEPILLYVDDNHSITIDETYGKVIKYVPVKDIPVSLQCLWIRYWWPSTVPDDICILSDIDMFPISKTYFIEQIQDISDNKYVHLNPLSNYFPSCYHVAKGYLFKSVLKLHDTFDESVTFINNMKIGFTHSFQEGVNAEGWGSDEIYATKSIHIYPDQTVFVFIKRRHNRIDRLKWKWSITALEHDKYADSHSIRPYFDEKNKQKIDDLVHAILHVKDNSTNTNFKTKKLLLNLFKIK